MTAPTPATQGVVLAPFNTTITIPSTANNCVVVHVDNYNLLTGLSLDNGSGTVVSFTKGDAIGGGNQFTAELWYALNVPAGTYTPVLSGGTTFGLIKVSVWGGVDQTTPWPVGFAHTRNSSYDGFGIKTTLTGVPANCVVLDAFGTNTDFTPTPQETGQTALGGVTTAEGFIYLYASYRYASGTVDMTWRVSPNGGHVVGALQGISAAPTPVNLGILTQPTEATTHHSFTITVAVRDAGGSTVTGDTSSVTLAPSGTGSASFLGNLTVAAVAGVATFALTPTKNTENASITFTASSGSLTPAVASAITLKVQSLDVAVS